MVVDARQTASLKHESELAQVSLSGIRILVQSSVAPGTSANASYTVVDQATRRVVLFHDSGTNTDIRVEQGAAATATDMPVASGIYFVLEAVVDETVQGFNTSAGAITVNILEMR